MPVSHRRLVRGLGLGQGLCRSPRVSSCSHCLPFPVLLTKTQSEPSLSCQGTVCPGLLAPLRGCPSHGSGLGAAWSWRPCARPEGMLVWLGARGACRDDRRLWFGLLVPAWLVQRMLLM